MKNAIIFLLLASALFGCSGSSGPPPLDPEQQKQANDLDSIAKRSGGDWNKLSDADKKAMIQISGSEQGAKMLLMGSSGKLGHHGPPGAGGPGPGGPPSGAPQPAAGK